VDSPQTTLLRRRIIREKPFLRRIYEEWYRMLAASVPSERGEVLELGSGAGFLAEFIPGLITSDVFEVPGVSAVVDAHRMPFEDGALRAIVMTNVLHHLQDPQRFFAEAAGCVRDGGVVTMIEPWNTPWARLVYTTLHPEPFDPSAKTWRAPSGGPLSGANGALPWVLFCRDRPLFERRCPQWRIDTISPFMPFAYLLSGGVSMRSFLPGWTYRLWRCLEDIFRPWMSSWAMFALIVLVRTGGPGPTEVRDRG